jgi:hypothetical protein
MACGHLPPLPHCAQHPPPPMALMINNKKTGLKAGSVILEGIQTQKFSSLNSE